MGQFTIYILSLQEQADRASVNQRKRLSAKDFHRGKGTRGHGVHGFCTAFPKFLRPFVMHDRRRTGRPHRFTQKSSLFAITFNEMDLSSRVVRKRAGNRYPWKAATRSEVDPKARLRRQRQELERISDMAGAPGVKGWKRDGGAFFLSARRQRDAKV